MADRASYLLNNEDQISAQKRSEQESGGSLSSFVITAGSIAGFLVMRRKLALARVFSEEVLSAGVHGEQLSRFAITKIISDKNAPLTQRVSSWARNVYEGVRAPIPNVQEQLDIATARIRQFGTPFKGRISYPQDNPINNWNLWKTFTKGPAVAAMAPGAPIINRGINTVVGRHGGLFAGNKVVTFGKYGEITGNYGGFEAGIRGTSAAKYDFWRMFGSTTREYTSLEEFVRGGVLPTEREMMREGRRKVFEDYITDTMRVPIRAARVNVTTEDVMKDLRSQIDEHWRSIGSPRKGPYQSSSKILSVHHDALNESLRDAVDRMTAHEMGKREVRLAYRLHRVQARLGFGVQFAQDAYSGQFLKHLRDLKGNVGIGSPMADPRTGHFYKPRPIRYINEKASLSGYWRGSGVGQFYPRPEGGSWKAGVGGFIEGTFFRQPEEVIGLGLSSVHTKATRALANALGASEGSYGDVFLRRYVGGFQRLATLGIGAYAAYRAVNYAARQVTGWGIDDAVGGVYTTARELQQHALAFLGVVNASKKAEQAFPGLIKSPASALFRTMVAPFLGAQLGFQMRGPKGGLMGLAAGVAFGLITWGDITQTPDELHRIFSGEQDIPVRKGRYWMFGKTPFGGGKIMYWRPHWYPLLKSKYKYQGQLWDSETEELAQGSFASPILAPLLTQKMWDPYYWEKKHYYDRPYPVTGELFEPTMPFAWLGNLTIGNLIKPQRPMHSEYSNVPQQEGIRSRTTIGGTSTGFLPGGSPSDLGYKLSEGAYTTIEQMGIRGFFLNTMYEQLTGNRNFSPSHPVAESARRATGYERSYWDMNIGDPFGVTEFFRRILAHRRREIEQYNPIENTMPDWLPGEDNYINFRTGDPYTKVEMGEARLPGAGYESLHTLHSGIPGVYDAMDRFLILSDIAPYSKEYQHYKILASSMTKKDPYWSDQFKKHVLQREKTQQEFEFLEMEPPEDVPALLKPLSSIYRRGLGAFTSAASTIEPIIGFAASKSPFGFAYFPVSKFLPYKTAKQQYKDYRLYGSDFTDWGNFARDFVIPFKNQIVGAAVGLTGQQYIPPEEQKRREYEEYFDRLQYIKFKKLQSSAIASNNQKLASSYSMMSGRTMAGVNPYLQSERMVSIVPKRERAFFNEFASASPSEQGEIIGMMSPQMRRIYQGQWSMRDGVDRGRAMSEREVLNENAEYFSRHNIPDESWEGWRPEVDIKDAQLKVVRNEGMNIHNFDLWESQARSMGRRPYVSPIENINEPTGDVNELKRQLYAQLENDGYHSTQIHVTQTPSTSSALNVKLKIKRDRSKARDRMVSSGLSI